MCFDNKVDYYDLAGLLDFVSNDIYPAGHWQKQPHQPESELAACHDVIRGYKKNKTQSPTHYSTLQSYHIFVVTISGRIVYKRCTYTNHYVNCQAHCLEQQSGMAGWEIMGRALEPGQMSAWAMQSVAHGADTVVFFRWRTCAMGTEQFWHGILGHSGKPGRIYKEAKKLTQTFTKYMEDFEGSMPSPEVAIVHSFRQNYALDIQPNHPQLRYVEQLQTFSVIISHHFSIAYSFFP